MKLDFLENMTTKEKVVLVEEIQDNIEKDYIEISNAQKKELNRRIELIDKGEAKYYSIDEVFDRLKEKRK